MKFDFCIGNPPYQGDNHQQLYPDFYLQGQKIANCVDLIFPVGWQDPKNANNLSKLNKQEIKEDPQICFVKNKRNVFQNIVGAEFTNIILWKKGHDNGLDGNQLVIGEDNQEIVKHLDYEKSSANKPHQIQELGALVVSSKNFNSLAGDTSSLKPYGLRTDFFNDPSKYGLPELQNSKRKTTDLTIYGLYKRKNTKFYVPKDYALPKISSNIDKYKVFIGKAWGNFSDNYLGGAYADIIVASPGEICTENFIESGSFDNFELACKHAKYLMTKFCRALLYLNKFTQDNSKDKWVSVPKQDFTENFWSESIEFIDKALMDKYDIPTKIQEFVFSNIQTRTEKNIINYREIA